MPDFWKSLSSSDQELIKAAAAAENNRSMSEYMHNNAIYLEKLVNEIWLIV